MITTEHKKANILFVSSNYFPKIGGIETQIFNYSKIFKKRGHIVSILTEQIEFDHRDNLYGTTLRIKPLRSKNIIFSILNLFCVAYKIKQISPDLIIGRSITALTLYTLILKKLKFISLPYLLYVDTLEEIYFIKNLNSPVRRVLVRLLTKDVTLVAPSRIVFENIKKLSSEVDFQNILLTPNAFFFEDSITDYSPKKIPLSFAFLGTLNENKNIELALSAFAKACELNPMATLHIGGDGPLREDLEEFVKHNSISDNVKFYGQVEPTQTIDFLSDKSYFFFPSKLESFGLAAYEAAISGCTLIANRVADLEAHLSDMSYFYNNEDELVALLLLIVSGNIEIKNKKILQLSNLSFENSCERILKLLNDRLIQ